MVLPDSGGKVLDELSVAHGGDLLRRVVREWSDCAGADSVSVSRRGICGEQNGKRARGGGGGADLLRRAQK